VDRIDEAIDALLEKRPEGFRNKDLATALGVSRPRASQILSARQRCGELVVANERRRGRYVRGPGSVTHLSTDARFWRSLTERCPCIAYYPLRAGGSPRLIRRSQVRAVIRVHRFEQRFALVDFDCITSLSDAACDELFLWLIYRRAQMVHAINAAPDVVRTLERGGYHA
jgi:hypothetical protein